MLGMFGLTMNKAIPSTSALIIALITSITVLLPAVARAQDQALSPEEQQIFSLLNAERSAAGLGLLTVDPLLNQAAQAHADDILNNRNYSHYGTDGTLARHRVARTGYSDAPWVSENWVSSRNPEAAMNWWMNDTIHRVNILTPRWAEVGIGGATQPGSGEMVFVTVFSPGRDASAAAVSVPVVASAASRAKPIAVPAGGTNYTVHQGDTLLAIALRYGYGYEELAEANGLSETSLLQIGQVLRIPGSSGDAVGSVSGGTGGPVAVSTKPYVIASGDTLMSIAAKYSLTWQEIASMNGLGERSILNIGQTLQVPVQSAGVGASAEDNHATAEAGLDIGTVSEHRVDNGDTLFGLSLTHHVSLDTILALNGLDENSILQPGQVIRLR